MSNQFNRDIFLVARDLAAIKDFFEFKQDFKIIESELDQVRFFEDLNYRREKDAQILSLIAANAPTGKMLDIGTYLGHSAARMAINSPNSTIYTVNIDPSELHQGGKRVTGAPSKEDIGSFYKENNLKNITQIFANTLHWDIPDEISDLSLVYIDGCHDKDCVYNDTKLIFDRVQKGGFILWHDCSPIYRNNYEWINDSMIGIERFYEEFIKEGLILNFQDSWIGIWQKK